MQAALQGQPVLNFPPRAGIGDSSVYTPPPSTTSTTSSSTTTTTTTTHHDDDHDDGSPHDDHHDAAHTDPSTKPVAADAHDHDHHPGATDRRPRTVTQ